MNIVEFLRARLDEDEREARDAAEERRRVGMGVGPDYGFQSWPDVGSPSVLVGPDRVLREVEAKRRIAERHAGCEDVSYGDASTCPDMRALASVYADHEDYDPEWAT